VEHDARLPDVPSTHAPQRDSPTALPALPPHMKPCGTGTGTIMTPYSEYGYGGVVGWDDLGGISLPDLPEVQQ
jgi:hypothetical protein